VVAAAGGARPALDPARGGEAYGGEHQAGGAELHVDGVGLPVAAQQLRGVEAHDVCAAGRGEQQGARWCGDWHTPGRGCPSAANMRARELGAMREGNASRSAGSGPAPCPVARRHPPGTGQPLAKVDVWVKGAWARSSRFSSSRPCSTGTSITSSACTWVCVGAGGAQRGEREEGG
jgi:hypothetical protein